jgi:hypothetical protein
MPTDPTQEADTKVRLWDDLNDRVNFWREHGQISEVQIYRLLADFAKAHETR